MPLHEIDKKLEYFTGVMLNDAIMQSQKITSKLSKKESTVLQSSKVEIEHKINREKDRQITEIYEKEEARVNARVTENKRELLEYREKCAKEVLEDVKIKIAEFTKLPEYGVHLEKLLQKGLAALNTDEEIEVRLREADMKYADSLKKLDTKNQLSFGKDKIFLGGLCLVCHKTSMRVDITFEGALEDMVGHFSEITGLGK